MDRGLEERGVHKYITISARHAAYVPAFISKSNEMVLTCADQAVRGWRSHRQDASTATEAQMTIIARTCQAVRP